MTKYRNRLWAISAAFCFFATVAGAADNSLLPVAVGNETFANKDIGNVHFPKHILYNSSGTEVGTTGAPLFIQSASGAFASGSFASGAFASGSFSAGAYAAGAFAAGAGVDGWDLTQGSKADAAWTSGSGSSIALLKAIATTAANPLAAQAISNVIGGVGLNATPTLANGNGVVPTQGGAVLSATNGWYGNLLQGNAVLSATNGTFANVLQGNAALSATNGLFSNTLQGNAVLSLTNPGFTRVTDGTTGITVKAASTPAGAGDTAIVVDQRPGSIVSASPGTLALGSTFVSGTTAAMTGTTSTQVIALVSSKIIYVTRMSCKGDPANAVGTKVQIRDGSAGTVLDTMTVGASGGGEQGTGATPLYWTSSGNAVYAQNVTTGASVVCTGSGYSG